MTAASIPPTESNIHIVREPRVMIYEAFEETAQLLRVTTHATHLSESLKQDRAGQREEHDLER